MSEKKPRSAAQIAAFEKAKAAREGNLRKKFQEEHEQQQRQQEQQQQQDEQQPDVQQPDEQPSEDSGEQQQHGMYTEDFSIVPVPPGAKTKYPRTKRPRVPPLPNYHDDSDYIELDTDALFSQLETNQREIKELRDHMHGLKQGHDELQSTWAQHDVGRRNELSFV
jgi:hypothetical protein